MGLCGDGNAPGCGREAGLQGGVPILLEHGAARLGARGPGEQGPDRIAQARSGGHFFALRRPRLPAAPRQARPPIDGLTLRRPPVGSNGGAMSSFDPLLDEHEEFVETLLTHQEALVRGDLESGRDLIAQLQAMLHAHIRHEEEKLLPVLERGGGWGRIGDPRYYREEHAKIQQLVAELVEHTNALLSGDPRLHREIALLVGREQAFRSLLEHHDDRERRALFPDLERLTTPEERARLLEPPE